MGMAHSAWKMRLQNYVEGRSSEKLDANQIAQDSNCELGKWVYGEGTAYKSSPIFDEIQKKHQEFHRLASEVVQLKNSGNEAKAKASLAPGGSFALCSQDTLSLLVRLKVQVMSKKAA